MAVVVRLLDAVLGMPSAAARVVAVFGVVLIALNGLVMRYGGVGVSKAFPPQAYCLHEGGSTDSPAPGAQFVFRVCSVSSLLLLAAGLWQVARDPKTLARQFRTGRSLTR
ncbi:hypothetical protein ACFV7R_32290 [Streptomyces sp. NPDC059866]|uniref:hypothetical protein n=1 Tax=Streptomyces sp. NPDC059866 TaxID=3346978 RepID=UPI00365A32EC